MKHTTKPSKGTTSSSSQPMIGLRLPPEEMAVVRAMAAADDRPVAQFARMCFRLGLEQLQQSRQSKKD